MRIVQITTLAGPGPVAGGVWQVAKTQTQALRDAGHSVELFAGWHGNRPPRDVDGVELTASRARQLFPGLDIRMLWVPGLVSQIHTAALAADVVHMHLCRDYVTTRSLRILRDAGTPIVAQSHGMLSAPTGIPSKLFDAVALRGRDLESISRFLALTEVERHRLEGLGVSPSAITAIDNAVLVPSEVWSNPTQPLFLFASRLHERKKPEIFVRAALKCLQSGRQALFVLAGPDQGETSRMRKIIDESAFSNSFHLAGALDHGEIESLLSRATAMVLPSVDEPYPMIALEAAAAGTPIIITNQTGISRGFAEDQAALVVESRVEPFAKAMISVYDDRTLRGQLSVAGRASHARRWSTSSLVTQLERIYRGISTWAHEGPSQ